MEGETMRQRWQKEMLASYNYREHIRPHVRDSEWDGASNRGSMIDKQGYSIWLTGKGIELLIRDPDTRQLTAVVTVEHIDQLSPHMAAIVLYALDHAEELVHEATKEERCQPD